MKTLTTWATPVAVSLMLHAALMVLITYRLSSGSAVQNQIKIITVELLGSTATLKKTQKKQEQLPATVPHPQTSKTESTTLPIPVPVEQKTSTETPRQSTADKQQPESAVDEQQASISIQPLSKLSRPPAFLHKIDPVYPASERRAGSQAYVLAEVTIDDKGNVLQVKIVKSAGLAFDHAVMDALEKSNFVPGYMGQVAVAVRVLVPFRFNLK